MRQTSVFWPLRKIFVLPRYKTLENQPSLWTRAISLWLAAAFLVALIPFINETALFTFVREITTSFREPAKWLTYIAESSWYLVPSGLVIIITGLMPLGKLGLGKRLTWYKWRLAAFFIFITIACSGLLTISIKIVVGRFRPVKFSELGAYAFEPCNFGSVAQSFPSGHATTCGALAMLLVFWFPRHKILWLLLGAGIALTRIVLAKHYMSDIIIGYNLGLIFTLLAARFYAQRGVMFDFEQAKLTPKLKQSYKLF